MTIISRYITKEFFKYFSLSLIVVMSIFVTTDYLTRIASFLKAELSLVFGFQYVLLKVPYMTVMLMPVCAMLSVVILFGLMSKNNEIMSLQSGGISSYYLIKPVAVTGLLLSIFCFIVSETIVPLTAEKETRIKLVDIKKKSITSTRDNNIWLKRENEIIRISHYNNNTKEISGVSIYKFTSDKFQLDKRIDAAIGSYSDGRWVFATIIESFYDKSLGVFVSKQIPSAEYAIDVTPEDFKSVIRESREMSIVALLNYIRKTEAEGYDAVPSRVDFHAKIAFPFVCLLMLVSGAGIALSVKKSTTIPVIISYGIFFAFSFWIFYSICISLGYGAILPPVIAAWAATFVFTCLCGYILLNAE
jgi:lipopolysaccharide export system permease protein